MLCRLIPLACAIALTACTTFTDSELATIRAQRVTPTVYSKLSRGLPLNPADVIELERRGVADPLIIRQIEDHGVASLIERADVKRMRSAGVSAAVIDALLWESDDFARRYVARDYGDSYGPYYGMGPWYGGVGVGYGTGGYYGGGYWR